MDPLPQIKRHIGAGPLQPPGLLVHNLGFLMSLNQHEVLLILSNMAQRELEIVEMF